MESSRYIELLNEMAKKYLPEQYRNNPEKIYTLKADNAVLTDLKTIKGKKYNDLSQNENLAQLAKDAFEWNKFLLKKKYGVDVDADIAAGKYSEEDAFLNTTIHGHKGALPYLNGKKKQIQTADETKHESLVIIPHNEKPKQQDKSAEKDDDALLASAGKMPELKAKSYTLDDVEVTANAAPKVLESGRNEEQINSEGQQAVNEAFKNEKDLNAKDALKIVDKVVGKDNVALKINDADVATAISAEVKDHGVVAVWPLTQMESVKAYNVLKDKYPDAGEVQIKTDTGQFTSEEKLMLEYFAENKVIPGSVEQRDGKNYVVFEPTKEEIDKYLPELSEKEKKQFLKPLEVKMTDNFTAEANAAWKDWAESEGKGLKREIKFEVFDQTINMSAADNLYKQLNKDNKFDYDYINTALGDYKNVSFREFREFEVNNVITSRPAAYYKKEVEKITEKPAEYTAEQVKEAKDNLEAHKQENLKKIGKSESLAEVLHEAETKNKAVGKFIKISELLEKKEAITLELDKVIMNYDKETAQKKAKEYLRDSMVIDMEISAVIVDKKKLLEEVKSEIPNIKDEKLVTAIKTSLEKNEEFFNCGAENELDEILNLMNNNATLKKDKSELNGAVTYKGGYYKNEPLGNEHISDLGLKFKGVESFGKFDVKADANINAGILSNYMGKDEFVAPLEFNNVTRENQKLDIGVQYNFKPLKSLEGEFKVHKNNAGTQQESGVHLNFDTPLSNSFRVGAVLPGMLENPLETIKPLVGGSLGFTKKIFMTGDKLEISGDVSVSAAEHKNFIRTESNLPFLNTSIAAKYNNKNFSLAVQGGYKALYENDLGKEITNIKSLNMQAGYSLDKLSLMATSNIYSTPEFNMLGYGAQVGFTTGNLSHKLHGNITNVNVDISDRKSIEEDIIQLGYRLGFKSNNKLLNDLSVGFDVNKINSSLPAAPIYAPFMLTLSKSFQK